MPAREFFERAAFASALARAQRQEDALPTLRAVFGDDPVARLILARAAVAAGATSGWAGELAAQAVADFVSNLPSSAAAAIIARGVRVRLDGGNVRIPVRSGGPAPLPWVAEGGPIAVKAFTIAGATLGPRKMGVLVMATRELILTSAAEPVFRALLREDASVAIDAGFFSAESGDATVHRGLLAGLTPLTASPEGGREAMIADLASVAAAAAGMGTADIVLVMSPARAATVQVMLPELRIPVLASSALPPDRVVGLDAGAIVTGFGTEAEIDSSSETLVHASDTPTNIGTVGTPNIVAAPTRSLFQTDVIATRLLLDIAFATRRPGAVAYLDGASWE